MQSLFSEKKITSVLSGFLFLMLLTPFVIFPQLSRSLLVSKWLFLSVLVELAFLFCLSCFTWKSIGSRLKHPLFVFYVISVLWIVISSVFGVDPLNSFWGNAARPGGWFFLLHLCLLLAVLLCVEKKTFEKSLDWFIWVGALVSLYAILERIGIVQVLGGHFESRATSTIGNPIYLAGFLLIPLTLSIFQLLKNKQSRMYQCTSILIFIAIIAAWTRGTFLGLAVGAFVGGMIWVWNRFGWKYSISIMVGVIALSAVLFPYTHVQDRNILDRLGYWNIALQSFYEHQIMGVGYENFYRPAEKFYTPDLYAGEGTFIDKPHNQTLETLATSGLVGLGFFLAIIFFATRLLSRHLRARKISVLEFAILIGGLIAFHVQNLFVFDTITTFFAYVYFLAFLVHLEQKGTASPLMSFRKPIAQWTGCIFAVLFIGAMSMFLFFPIGKYFHLLYLLKETRTPEQTLALRAPIGSLPFLYDAAEMGKFYKKSAGDLLSLNQTDLSNVDALLQVSTDAYQRAVDMHPNRGEYWYQLASVSMMRASAHKQPMSETEKKWIQQSMSLMPNRVEPKIAEAYAFVLDGKSDQAVSTLEELDQQFFQSSQFLWTLAIFYRQVGRADDAAEFGYRALQDHVRVNTASAILWIADHYAQKQDFQKVVYVYETVVAIESENVSLLPNLLAAYVSNNQPEKAIEIAKRIQEKDPDHAAEAKDFIDRMK